MTGVVEVAEAVGKVAEGGMPALVALVILALAFGFIQPRANVTRASKGHDELVTELRAQVGAWKAAHDEAEKARRAQELLLDTAVAEIRETVRSCRPAAPPSMNGAHPYA